MADESSPSSGEGTAGRGKKRDEPEPSSDDDQIAGPSCKQIKLDESEEAQSSCVLSFRGLPNDITEAEVASLAQLFGDVTNIILTRNKHKALVEMSELSAAEAMMDHYLKQPLYVRSSHVVVQYSQHSELKLKVGDQDVSMDSSRCVLHIIVDNMTYPVSVDLLNQIFSAYGRVLKIVTFNHNESFHALIQYENGASARMGKLSLNGQNVFNGCCKLYIEFSKLQDLVVKYNSDISRDYTNPNIVWNDSPAFSTVTLCDKSAFDNGGLAAQAAPQGGLLPNPVAVDARAPVLLNLPSPSVPSMFLPPRNAVMQYTNPFYSSEGRPSVSVVPAPPGLLPKKVPWSERRPVVLVSNLDEAKVTTDALFTLFGVYGDVIRVKICCNKRSKALVQYKDYKYARDAVTYLDGVPLWGRQLKLAISKYRIVQMPKEGAHNADLTQDYTTSRWHRFHNGDRAKAPVVPPSKTLFLANIPPKVSETKLKKMFNPSGTVVDFKFFEPSNLFLWHQAVQMAQLPPGSLRAKDKILNSSPDKRMALIEMSSVEEAVESLVTLHNKQFTGTSRYLCVSFTNSVIEHRDDK